MHTKRPPNPLPVAYRPAGSVSYHVIDGDSWASLAAARSVDPWWLIQYNFETRDPAEVNWYLQNRVGCKKTTLDGRNFEFSSAAKPGIIYLPTPQMARGLKNLSYGRFGIAVEGNDEYQRQAKFTLDWIARSDTGIVLLQAIQRTGKQVTVSPWTGTNCNATAAAEDYQAATPAGETVLMGGQSFEQVKEPSLLRDLLGLPKEPMLGTGKGSDVRIRFSPTMFGFGATGACSAVAGAAGASPSQVLFHEMAHAYRAANGTLHTRPTIGGSTSYTNMEEFFAVVLSNVLIADPSYSSANRTLRADHSGFTALAPALSTSRGFVSHIPNRNKMRELIKGDPQLSKELRGVKSYFNPFTEPL